MKQAHPNLSEEEQGAIQELVALQGSGNIVIKPNDKSGGWSIMDLKDYKEACNAQLSATYFDEDGIEQPYYRESSSAILNFYLTRVKDLVEEGVKSGYIHPDDEKMMVPSVAKPGRYYGLPKNHKLIALGKNIPPLRPVVSGSGSKTEGISHWVDVHSKSEVSKLESFVEDSRHMLEIICHLNKKGPQPSQAVPVTLDISGMYSNVLIEEGLKSI